jgi:hypothetical protein
MDEEHGAQSVKHCRQEDRAPLPPDLLKDEAKPAIATPLYVRTDDVHHQADLQAIDALRDCFIAFVSLLPNTQLVAFISASGDVGSSVIDADVPPSHIK